MANPKTLTTDETSELLNFIYFNHTTAPQERKAIRNYTIALLMLDAGLRVGEVVQLRISDLLFNSVPVTSIIIRPEIAKNKTERIIPVSERLSNALKKMNEYIWTQILGHSSPYGFYNLTTGCPITTRQVERIIRAAAMKALGRPVHPHILRHTFASRLMRTTDMRTVQELLGHKQLSSTQIYTHPNAEDLKKAIKSVEMGPNWPDKPRYTLPSSPDIANRPDTAGTDRDMG